MEKLAAGSEDQGMGGIQEATPKWVLSGLSLLSDSLGPFRDDVLLVEMKTGLNNTSVCALEPSGCTPLPSVASTVRTKEPFFFQPF